MRRISVLFSAVLSLLAVLWLAGCEKQQDCAGCDAGTSECPGPASPTQNNPSAPPDDIGEICAYDGDCAQHCILGLSGMAPYCTRSCESEACPSGYLCLSQAQAGMLCLMGACGDGQQCPDDYDCNAEDPENPVCRHSEIACEDDSDCPSTTACNQGLCELMCDGDEDCKQGFRCQWHRRCVKCVEDAHCENAFSCQDGNCNLSCADNSDCRLGFSCVNAECEKISDNGAIEFGAGDAGCEQDLDCRDFCYNSQYCTRVCEGEADTTCPEGYACHRGRLFCQMQ